MGLQEDVKEAVTGKPLVNINLPKTPYKIILKQQNYKGGFVQQKHIINRNHENSKILQENRD
jgi:hypothetical protein